MIEKFKVEISPDNRRYLNNLIYHYNNKFIPFYYLLKEFELTLNIGFFYFLATKLGVTYRQIREVAYFDCPISKPLEARIMNIINSFLQESDSFIISFDVQEYDKGTLAYLYAVKI